MSCHVWCKFEARKSDGTVLKLRIQDCPKSRIDGAVAIYTKYIINDGLFSIAAGVPQNPKALEECLEKNYKLAQDPAAHIMMCCEDEDDDKVGEINGVSIIYLVEAKSKSSEKNKPKSKEVQKLYNYDPMEQLKLSRYYSDVGLVVHPDFRKLGIATEFLKARRLACLAHDVPATGAFMTSVGSQKAAEKDNWETVLEISLVDLSRQHGVTFDGSGVRKVLIWKKPK